LVEVDSDVVEVTVEVSATVVEGFHKFPRRGRGALDEFIGISIDDA